MEFISDSGNKIPDSFQSSREGWKEIISPNFAGQVSSTQLFNTPLGNINNITNEDLTETEISSGGFSAFEYNSLTGIAFGEFNSRFMDAYSQTQYTNAMQGRGPLGATFNAQRTAEQTLTNQHEATAVAGLAMTVGGLLGPEGLVAGLALGAAIDYETTQGTFDADPAPLNTN
jgi:hypothetical protein